MTVFDAMGREVRRLVNQMQPAGSHIIEWNGKAADGNRVESGVYYYRLEAGNFRETKQMTLTQ
ncbi:MAG: FlgD immunoglobulin-like domain containing protein [Calditrichia bacterium]